MAFDKVTIENLEKVQSHIKQTKKKELSLEEISEIVNSQFIAANFAFKRKIDVRLPIIGTFKYNYKDALNVGMSNLKKLKDSITREEYVEHHRQLREDFIIAKKARKSKKIATIAELKEAATIIKTHNKYNSAINFKLDGTK